jgi:hypothetical protein
MDDCSVHLPMSGEVSGESSLQKVTRKLANDAIVKRWFVVS